MVHDESPASVGDSFAFGTRMHQLWGDPNTMAPVSHPLRPPNQGAK